MPDGVCTILGGAVVALLLAGYLGQHFLPPPKPSLLGIDLGTTYSCVGAYHAVTGQVDVLPDNKGHKCIPSVVAYSGDRILVGYEATAQIHKNPVNTFYDAKRFIGKRFTVDELEKEAARYPFKLRLDSEGGVQYEAVTPNGTLFVSPEDIGASILRTLRTTAEQRLGVPVTRIVMAVPAEFDAMQRNATKQAAKKAGLDVLRIINEPTAAALAYGLHTKDGVQDVMVIDLGGGTLDVSLLDIQGGMFLTRAMAGNNHLGGQDFNERLWRHLSTELEQRRGKPLTDPEEIQQLRTLVEDAKLRLTETHATELPLTFSSSLGNKNEKILLHVTRKTFEDINEDLFRKILEPLDRILLDAEMSERDVEAIVLVGGSTRVPKVREMIAEYFGKSPDVSVDPELAVVMGVSVQAGIIGGVWPLAVSAIEVQTTARKIQMR